ncbi:putative cytochrome b561/ferric reductase transmembrane [Medicago truncatula]|uniref:Eukaryotic cytochrome b561 protein n=1 Tax=Medicago truncatula TaxID=3880 RepID=A0A072UZZ0_MEDTR|nr:cytochrome b561 domain-containing protein At4g18260 isoform X2 [Medicago truncatula]KEH31385.1 eukaryotic cytochrome b561 protein [Medicago truncatula]RHN62875.1 putative cytochrome b561/ferric reductase transmembrane [Medicago truncatula]
MHISYKSACFVIVSFYAFVIPFTQCTTLKEVNQFNSQRNTNSKVHKVNHQKASDIALHGLLLWGSVGFLMPLGILTIRGSNKAEPGSRRSRILFYFHVAFQMLSVLLATVGAAMSLIKFENSFDNNHQRLGLALYGAILVQAFIGFFRPHRGKKQRSYWYFVHWILGTIVSLVGIINIFTGLKAYHKRTLKSTMFWTILFTVEVFFIGLIYLFQDKLEYMRKQGVIEGSDESTMSSYQDIPQRQQNQNQKEMLPIACGKINALGNLFD